MFLFKCLPEGYSGTANVAEKATSSSAGASLQSRISPLPSSVANQQLPATTLTSSSITPPHPTPLALSLKQEIHHPSTAGRTSQFAKAVMSNADVPLNQPVSFFPSDLLAPLLLRPSHLAAPTTAAPSTSINTLPSPESSARQQEQETREGLKAQPVKSDSEEATGGSRGKEQVQVKDAVVETSAPKRDKNASAAAPDSDDGNKSDDSVKMMEPSNPVVIDIDESDNEDSHEIVSNVPVHPEPPQTSVSVEFSPASTQTSQQNEDDR